MVKFDRDIFKTKINLKDIYCPLPSSKGNIFSSSSVGNDAAISSLYKEQDPDRIYNGVKRKNSGINMNKTLNSMHRYAPTVHSCSAVYKIKFSQPFYHGFASRIFLL